MNCPNCNRKMRVASLDDWKRVEWVTTYGCEWCGCTVSVGDGEWYEADENGWPVDDGLDDDEE